MIQETQYKNKSISTKEDIIQRIRKLKKEKCHPAGSLLSDTRNTGFSRFRR